MNFIRKEHWKYFFATFLWSWGMWLVPIMMGLDYNDVITRAFYLLGGIAPTSTGIILAYLKRDPKYWKSFWHRIVNFKLIKVKWYIIIFTLIPLCHLGALVINYLISGQIPELTTLKEYMLNPFNLILFALFTLFFGPIPEEIGWRGFALDHLEKKYSWFTSSLILGLFWSTWHIPLAFISGTYQNSLMVNNFPLYLNYNLVFFAQSVIMDWIYNNNHKSILSGVLFHFTINFYGEVFDFDGLLYHYKIFIQVVIAAVIMIYYWKKK